MINASYSNVVSYLSVIVPYRFIVLYYLSFLTITPLHVRSRVSLPHLCTTRHGRCPAALRPVIYTAMRILFLLLMLSSSASFAQKGVQTITIRTSAVCDMCKERIEKEMAFTKGVTSATLDVKTAVLTVSYKASKTDPATLRKAINLIGYDADSSPADHKAYEDLHHCCKKDSH